MVNEVFKVNLNEQVKVKLTDIGIAIMKQDREKLNSHITGRGGKGLGEYEPVVDDEGYTKFQLWDLMQRFGKHVGNAVRQGEAMSPSLHFSFFQGVKALNTSM